MKIAFAHPNIHEQVELFKEFHNKWPSYEIVELNSELKEEYEEYDIKKIQKDYKTLLNDYCSEILKYRSSSILDSNGEYIKNNDKIVFTDSVYNIISQIFVTNKYIPGFTTNFLTWMINICKEMSRQFDIVFVLDDELITDSYDMELLNQLKEFEKDYFNDSYKRVLFAPKDVCAYIRIPYNTNHLHKTINAISEYMDDLGDVFSESIDYSTDVRDIQEANNAKEQIMKDLEILNNLKF